MNGFHLVLPSNSSKSYYRDNTLTQFTTRLQSRIELSCDYECALEEIQFTRSWYNVPRNSGRALFSYASGADLIALKPASDDDDNGLKKDRAKEAKDGLYTQIDIPSGYYSSIQHIVDEFNLVIQDAMSHTHIPSLENNIVKMVPLDRDKFPRFRYAPIKKKVTIWLQPGSGIAFDDYLANMLGMRINPVVNTSKSPRAIGGQTAADLNGGINALYVYCDILQNVALGDVAAPLLRVIDASGQHGENIHRIYNPARYVPVRLHSFDSININIRTDLGEIVPFETGNVVVTLHFRPVVH
jgi:hypothetical protein